MKRPMTLTGGILGTVANAVFSVMFVLAMTIIFQTGLIGAIILGVLELAVVVVGLVLSILAIVAWNKDAGAFKKKKALLIVCAAFNLIGAILGFITGSVLYIILSLVLIASAVLLIVDVCLEGKRK